MRAWAVLGALATSVVLSLGCNPPVKTAVDPVILARQAGADSTDSEVIGRWLLTELVAPGGSLQQAKAARARLDDVAKDDHTLYASLARGLDDESHGEMVRAASAYLAALEAAKKLEGPDTELVAWFATSRLMALRPSVGGIWTKAKPIVESAIKEPGNLGHRARTDLVDWWLYESRRERGSAGAAALEEEAEKSFGCLPNVRFAGPFGRPAPMDVITSFDAEKPGVWPTAFPQSPTRTAPPRVYAGEVAEGVCVVAPAETGGPGVYYVETFFELAHDEDVLVSARAAWALLVDDVKVLSHDPRTFGTHATSTVALRLAAGRHRIVARLVSPQTYIRVLDLEGKPLGVTSSADPTPVYSLVPPTILPDPQPLEPFTRAASVPRQAGWPTPASNIDATDPVLRFFAAELARLEGHNDLATVLIEPLMKEPTRATPITLNQAAMFLEADPIFSQNDARDLALDYRRRAAEKDGRLWYAALWLLVDAADKQGGAEQLPAIAQLSIDFPEVSTIGKALAAVYARLGYTAEQKRVIVDLAKRFPDDVELMRLLVSIHDEEGRRTDADTVAARIEALDPSSTITVERAIARNDFDEAAKLLQAKANDAQGSAKKLLLRRLADILVHSGRRRETLAVLEQSLTEDPQNSRANLDLADARLARGDHGALRAGLAHALRVGSDASELRDAIEAATGITELEAYRLDPMKSIQEFESSGAAARGRANPKGGTAARVLDYAAVWIHQDGSARMLEHEILYMQSPEAIREHAEQRLPRGKLLSLRVITADGKIWEPEIVAGKPTATMAHIGVGDYIETETLYDLAGDRAGGRSFVSPRWMFREEKVDYHRSEYVIISPKDRALTIETTGTVPEPKVEEQGRFVVRRWRVDNAPALPNERFGAPMSEFLPSVRVGWGVSQEDTLSKLLDMSTRLDPADPRIVVIAKTIATAGAALVEQEAALAKVDSVERARRIYRWVLDNVDEEQGQSDPRKSVVGKSGSRLEAFLYLCRLVGVDARHAIVQDRLQPPPAGPIAEAEMFTDVAVAIPTGKGTDVWTIVGEKYAPFGYMPSALRGQPAVILRPGLPRVTTGTDGPPDGVSYSGKVVLSEDGSAKMKIQQSYTGTLAIVLRAQIQKIADEDKLRAAIESQMLPQALPGARLSKLTVDNLTDVDAPLVMHLDIEVSALARRQRDVLVMEPPFSATVKLAPLALLEKRETPLLLPAWASMKTSIQLSIELPKGAEPPAAATAEGKDSGRTYKVADRVEGSVYVIDRVLDVPAGRIAPSEYDAFVAFARETEQAMHRDIVVKLK